MLMARAWNCCAKRGSPLAPVTMSRCVFGIAWAFATRGAPPNNNDSARHRKTPPSPQRSTAHSHANPRRLRYSHSAPSNPEDQHEVDRHVPQVEPLHLRRPTRRVDNVLREPRRLGGAIELPARLFGKLSQHRRTHLRTEELRRRIRNAHIPGRRANRVPAHHRRHVDRVHAVHAGHHQRRVLAVAIRRPLERQLRDLATRCDHFSRSPMPRSSAHRHCRTPRRAAGSLH